MNRRGTIRLVVQVTSIEKFINALYANRIDIEDVKRVNANTIEFNMSLDDYKEFIRCAKQQDARYEIVKKKGIEIFVKKNRKEKAIVIGAVMFGVLIAYLNSFIWNVDIESEYIVSPYEIRQILNENGIGRGIRKSEVDAQGIIDTILYNNDEIGWVGVSIYGTTLNVQVAEKENPPIEEDTSKPARIVATKDGYISRVYTSAGTAVVSEGDMVKEGDVLVEGIQGNEGLEYLTHAHGEVLAEIFYEESRTINMSEVSKVKTGNEITQAYFEVLGKKIYIRNPRNTFDEYIEEEEKNGLLNRVVYYEVEEKEEIVADVDTMVENTVNELYNVITSNLISGTKIVDTYSNLERYDDHININVVVVTEESIGRKEYLNDKEIEGIIDTEEDENSDG